MGLKMGFRENHQLSMSKWGVYRKKRNAIRKQAKDTAMVSVVSCLLLLIALVVLLRSLRLLLPVMLLSYAPARIQGVCTFRFGPVLGRQTNSRPGPSRAKLGKDRREGDIDVIRRIHQGRAGISKDRSKEIDP